MPRWASSTLPILRPVAPVKAPFSWPKSSLSSRFSGIAAQLMATKGPLARGRELVERPAISSLPVPLSPSSSTVASVAGRALQREHRLLERRVLAQHARQPVAPLVVLLQQHQLGRHAARLDGAVEQQQQVVGVHGLGQEVGRPLLHGAHRVLDGAEGGHHHDRRLGVGVERRLQHVEPAARGQLQVGEHDEVAEGLELAAGLLGIARLVDGVAARLEGRPQHRAERLLVFDDQDVGQGGPGSSALGRGLAALADVLEVLVGLHERLRGPRQLGLGGPQRLARPHLLARRVAGLGGP